VALIACKECGKEISDRAKICPQCGVPLRFEVGCGTLLLVLLFAVVLLYSGCKEMINSQYNIFWEERFSR
jgi:predicted amidophosphoribosyltransferase